VSADEPSEPATLQPEEIEAIEAIEAIEEIAGAHVRPAWAPIPLVAFVGLVACGWIGTAVAPRWVNTNPEGLLMLHARVRHLLLVAGSDISFPTYALIGGLRLAAAYVVCHLIGRAFGRDVLVWFGRYLGAKPAQIQSILQLFHRAEWFVVPFFTGSNIVAAITGIMRIPLRRLVPLVAIGIAGRVVLWWWVADVADDEVDAVLDFLDRYQTPALIASVVLTVVVIGLNLRRGRDFTLDS
jgi:membrane protein DedA with SNARE-associated domain